MILKTGWIFHIPVTVFVTLFAFHCTSMQPDISGNSTQVGNGRIAGLIYQPDGITPAPNTIVYIRKKNTFADITAGSIKQSTDSSITDDSGRFTSDSLDPGLYIAEATDRKNDFVLIDSISVTDSAAILLPPATLRSAGAIKGKITLSDGSDPRKIFVLASGLDRFVTAGQEGGFMFGKLAEGNYHLRILPTLDNYSIFDTINIPVTSGDTFDIGTIELPFTGIPTVRNVIALYDTLNQWVKLQWNRPATGVVNYYNVYRREVEPATAVFSQLNIFPVIDTMFIDSFGTPNRIYEYRLIAADSITAAEGAKSEGVRVRISLYNITPDNVNIQYDTIRQTVTLRWSNPDTACVKSYNIYRRNIDRNEVFWTPFNDKPLTDTVFIDSTFLLFPISDSASGDSTGLNEPSYEYCIAALIHNVREGVKSAGISVRTCVKYLAPSNVKIIYDTLKQAVHLKWNRPDMMIIEGFAVFRRNIEKKEVSPIQINSSMLIDTAYTDSSTEQNNLYEYRVASVVNKERAIIKSARVNVRITASFNEDTIYSNRGSGKGDLYFPNDIAVASNGDIYIIDQGNSRIQVFDSSLHIRKQIGVGTLDYPLKIAVDDQGRIYTANYNSNRDASSIYIFDSAGTLVDTILDSAVINDLDVKDNLLYTLTNGRIISIHSIEGSTIRSWQGSGQDGGKWIVAGDSNRIFVNTGSVFPDKNKVTVFDGLGNKISTLPLPYYPYTLAVDSIRQLLYIVCYNGVHSAILHVFDRNYREIGNYKIKSDEQNISIALHQNGCVFLLFKGEGTILKLTPLSGF